MIYLLFAALSFGAFANEICPPPAMKVEIDVPSGKKLTCVYEKDGKIFKHGEELQLDAAGTVVSRKYYEHDQETKAAPAFAASNLPGAEEAAKKVGDGVEDMAMTDIMDILRVLTLVRTEPADKFFKVSGCEKDVMAWIMAAYMKQPLRRSYKYEEKCDVQGAVTVSFTEPFPVALDLRNLKEFNKTQMKVKIVITMSAGTNIHYRFDVLEGNVVSPKNSVDFTAYYEVDFDKKTKRFIPETQNGKLTLAKVNGKETSASRDINFNK